MSLTSPTPSKPSVNAWLEPHSSLDGLAPIDHLFYQLEGLYPQRWKAAFPSDRAVANWREVWAEGFAEERVTSAEIKAALKACRTKFSWPPSFAEFMSVCRQPIDFEAAFNEAAEQMFRRHNEDNSVFTNREDWSHPAIFWAANSIGYFDMRNATWSSIKSRWTSALERELIKKSWPKIPEARKALPSPGKQSIDTAAAQMKIAEMVDKLVEKMGMAQ